MTGSWTERLRTGTPGTVTGGGVTGGGVSGGGVSGAVGMPTMGMPILVPAGEVVTTIGVVIDVPEPYASELQGWRARFGDPAARAIPTHVTLLPPTAVPGSALDDVTAHLEVVAAATQAFDLRLRGTDTFRPVSPVVYVQVVEGAEGCDALQQRVRTGPLARELSYPYHPHVTVAHEVDEPALDRAMSTLRQYSCAFRVESIGLYEHGSDGVWRPRHTFGFVPATP